MSAIYTLKAKERARKFKRFREAVEFVLMAVGFSTVMYLLLILILII